jgi:uracil-DNA glycosylase family 4
VSQEEHDILQLAQDYLRQHGELFGEVLYLDPVALTQSPRSSDMLEGYHEFIRDCQKCPLARTRHHLVFGAGNPEANLMLIGEAPGEDEDLQGKPFVGKAGQLLDKILAAIDFQRQDIYIGNILKCRPPGNRDPLPEEIALCLPHIHRQIEIIQPRTILTLGRIAAQTLLGTTSSLGRLRGRVHTYRDIPLIATYHPAALLRNPQWKYPVWEDVQKLRHLYDERVRDKPKWQPPKRKQ